MRVLLCLCLFCLLPERVEARSPLLDRLQRSAPEVALPSVAWASPAPPGDHPRLVLNRQGMWLDDVLIAHLTDGVFGSADTSGDLHRPLRDALQAHRDQVALQAAQNGQVAPDPWLRLAMDASLVSDRLITVLYSAGQVGIPHIALEVAVDQGDGAILPLELPALPSPTPQGTEAERPRLHLSVAVQPHTGLMVHHAPLLQSAAPGVLRCQRDCAEGWPLQALRDRARLLFGAAPYERTAILAFLRDLTIEEVADLASSLHRDEAGRLFPFIVPSAMAEPW